jgi:D-arabinose 1-dehydrogenase-like Zn-dependent alcohol dehydrogenase
LSRHRLIRAHPGRRGGVRAFPEAVISQETSDFCGKHGIAAEIETIPVNQAKDAFERVICSDVRFRFVIDMATL